MAKTFADAEIRIGFDPPSQGWGHSFLVPTAAFVAKLAKTVSETDETRMALRRRRYASLLR